MAGELRPPMKTMEEFYMIRVKAKQQYGPKDFVVCVPYLAYDEINGTLWWEEDYPSGVEIYELKMSQVLAEIMICKALEFGYVDLSPYGFVQEVLHD